VGSEHLVARGVHVEPCGAISRAQLGDRRPAPPEVSVNTDALARTIALVQDGYIKITEA
jgi:hypothetical protein